MRKKFCCFLGLSLVSICFLSNVFALEIGGQAVEITVTDAYVSRYIWRGQDLYGQNDGAHQLSIDVTLPNLFYGTDVGFNVWGSFATSDGHEDLEELDYTISFSRDVLDEQFNVSTGFTYFDFPNTASTADVSEPWLAITLNKIPFLPIDISANVFAAYDFQAKSGGPDEGWYYSWGFDTELELPNLPFKCALLRDDQTLSLGVVNWGNDGVADLEPSSLYATEFSVSTSYALKDFSIAPSLHYTINHEEKINSGDGEVWGGVEVSYGF